MTHRIFPVIPKGTAIIYLGYLLNAKVKLSLVTFKNEFSIKYFVSAELLSLLFESRTAFSLQL